MSLCVLTRFKNEKHILYEFVNHYLLEGVDTLILIDNGSDDNFINDNNQWLLPLILENKVSIIENKTDGQQMAYNKYLNLVKKHKWVIV